MTSVACFPTPDTLSPSTLPDGLTWQDHLSDAEYADLLNYLARRAHAVHRQLGECLTIHELEDAGVAGLTRALTTWDSRHSHGVPLRLYAKLCIKLSIANAPRDYSRWCFPTPPSDRWLPPADALRPTSTAHPAQTVMQAELLEWLDQQLRQHRRCLSPSTRQALDDFLAERSLVDCAARDGVPYERARSAQRLMFAALRRHIGLQETTCAEEQASWANRARGYSARNRREVSYAAAD